MSSTSQANSARTLLPSTGAAEPASAAVRYRHRLTVQPQHVVAAAREFVRDWFDGSSDPLRVHCFDHLGDVRRGCATELQQGEGAYLGGRAQQFAQGVEMKGQVELLAMEEQEVRRERQVEGVVGKREVRHRPLDVTPFRDA